MYKTVNFWTAFAISLIVSWSYETSIKQCHNVREVRERKKNM